MDQDNPQGPAQDPLRDPRFPARPQSRDYWRIIEVVAQQDGRSTEGGPHLQQVVADIVDERALTYVGLNRAMMAQDGLGLRPDDRLTQMLAAVWIDAFTAGIRFEQAGGHQAD